MKAPLCPICREAPPDPAHRPFCSARCKTRDLHRWLSEIYRVPDSQRQAGADIPDAAEDEAPPASPKRP